MAARIRANREGGAGGGGFGSGGGEAAAGALGSDMVASPGEGLRRRSRVGRDVESPGRNVGDGSYSSAEAVAGGLFFAVFWPGAGRVQQIVHFCACTRCIRDPMKQAGRTWVFITWLLD